MTETNNYKICTFCGIKKEIIDFYPSKSQKFGVASCCRKCTIAKQRDYVKKNKEKVKKYHKSHYELNKEKFSKLGKEYRDNNREKMLLAWAKTRAKKEGIPFDIEECDIVIPVSCPVLGMPIYSKYSKERKFTPPNTPTLDKIVPELGYTKGNVRVISWRANNLKRDASIHELKCIVKYMEEHFVRTYTINP